MGLQARVTQASLTAENTFTDAIQIFGPFNFSLSGTFVASVIVQRSFYTPATGTWGDWHDVSSAYTTPKEDIGIAPSNGEGVQYRAGIKTGDYTSGTIEVRISQ